MVSMCLCHSSQLGANDCLKGHTPFYSPSNSISFSEELPVSFLRSRAAEVTDRCQLPSLGKLETPREIVQTIAANMDSSAGASAPSASKASVSFKSDVAPTIPPSPPPHYPNPGTRTGADRCARCITANYPECRVRARVRACEGCNSKKQSCSFVGGILIKRSRTGKEKADKGRGRGRGRGNVLATGAERRDDASGDSDGDSVASFLLRASSTTIPPSGSKVLVKGKRDSAGAGKVPGRSNTTDADAVTRVVAPVGAKKASSSQPMDKERSSRASSSWECAESEHAQSQQNAGELRLMELLERLAAKSRTEGRTDTHNRDASRSAHTSPTAPLDNGAVTALAAALSTISYFNNGSGTKRKARDAGAIGSALVKRPRTSTLALTSSKRTAVTSISVAPNQQQETPSPTSESDLPSRDETSATLPSASLESIANLLQATSSTLAPSPTAPPLPTPSASASSPSPLTPTNNTLPFLQKHISSLQLRITTHEDNITRREAELEEMQAALDAQREELWEMRRELADSGLRMVKMEREGRRTRT